MTKHDLYKILGVRKNASKGAIDSAYRRRALERHPDRNPGDETAPDDFKRIQLAYDVLSDPERRERYDQTGEYEEIAADNTSTEVVSVLTQVFAAVAQAIQNSGKDPTRVDVLEGMRRELNGALDTCRANHAEVTKSRAFVDKFSGRFVTDKPDNFLESFVREQVRRLDQELENVNQQRELHERALKMLGAFVYKHEATPEPDKARRPVGMLLGMPVYMTTNI